MEDRIPSPLSRSLVAALIAGVLIGALGAPPVRGAASLSLREKIGQLVMFGLNGTALTPRERDAIERYHLGGVILFADNYRDRTQLERLTRQIQGSASDGNRLGIGALIAVDQEGGVVKRFPDMPPNYSAPQMGEIGRKELAYKQGRATGRALRSVGVNVDLAPVADLDLPPNHVMRTRSFGANPYRVARLVQAFGRGLQSRAVAATVKHFPGLGGATRNSDDGRAYVYRTRRQLREVDAIPFHRASRRSLRLMMLSHAIYPHLGGDRPASLNRAIARRLLRERFDFEGVAISDALEPVVWKVGGSIAEACVATVAAGVDIALMTSKAPVARACTAALRGAVRTGRLSEHRIDQAVARVLELKRWLGLHDPRA